MLAWVLGLAIMGGGLGAFVPPVWVSAHLRDPVRTTAISVEFHNSCARCTNVFAEFYDRERLLHRVELHAPTNAKHYQAGMGIVYSGTNPNYAMALNSYNEGRGFDRTIGLPVTAALLAVEVVAGGLALTRWLLRRATRRDPSAR